LGRQAANLVDVFRARAHAQPDAIAFTFLAGEENPLRSVSYLQLDRQAQAIASQLQQLTPPGARALLMYEAGLDYVAALAGCLYAGVVAVPAYPPDPMRAQRTLPRLEAIVRDAGATILLGTTADLAWTGGVLGKLPGLEAMIATNEIDSELARSWTPPVLARQSLALLQYTSGSTGDPKGVMLSHGNLLANLAQMEATIDVDDAVAALWLPAYHDMGLIGGILQCWYSGRRSVMLSPVAFFTRPLRWLKAISDYRATTTGAPDFAYDLCVRKIKSDERRQLDLSCWKLALSGAEPVRPLTIARFVDAFAECGVRPEIFRPCYGLAEATLMVSCSRQSAATTIRAFDHQRLAQNQAIEVSAHDPLARHLAGCGRAVPDEHIIVVDPVTRQALPPGRVGEIWVAGDNVARGYWNNPQASAETFGARTRQGDGPFLRTGDAGFFHEGELFISGRLKDVIIVHGRNHYPQDIEQSVESAHEALKTYGGAAFSMEDGQRERLVVVHEVARPSRYDLDQVSRAVRLAVLQNHDLVLDAVVLIRQGTIPKTTSGKIQRSACRDQFLQGGLQVLHLWSAAPTGVQAALPQSYVAPRTPTEKLLAAAWAEVLGLSRVGALDDFFELGGHSLLAAQLVNRLRPKLGVELSLEEMLRCPTVAALAAQIDAHKSEQEEAERQFLEMLEEMSDVEAECLLAQANLATATIPAKTPAEGGRRPPANRQSDRAQTSDDNGSTGTTARNLSPHR
jgi:acyl-CoA synthetase (AMP-forming)/AMP-acid ligase II/acyl carrier protein